MFEPTSTVNSCITFELHDDRCQFIIGCIYLNGNLVIYILFCDETFIRLWSDRYIYYFPGLLVISLLLFILDTAPIIYRVKLLFE